MEVHLIRHGEYSMIERFCGQVDGPLTDLRVQQAHAVARRLSATCAAPVYSSDMKRSRETAQIIGDMPVLYARRGVRVIRVECPGYEVYERSITVLGDPNHQVLNVVLAKE